MGYIIIPKTPLVTIGCSFLGKTIINHPPNRHEKQVLCWPFPAMAGKKWLCFTNISRIHPLTTGVIMCITIHPASSNEHLFSVPFTGSLALEFALVISKFPGEVWLSCIRNRKSPVFLSWFIWHPITMLLLNYHGENGEIRAEIAK